MQEESEAQAGFARITAPFDGVIVERNVEPGQLVSETHQNKPLLILQDTEKLTVTVGVPEIEAPIVNIGDEMQVFTSQDSATPAIVGKVQRTSLAFNPVTRTIRAEFDFASPNENLRSGQYVLVRIIGHKAQEAVTVPNQAIMKFAGVPHCHVIEGNQVRRVPVTLGVADTSRVTIINGINAGDLVVIGPVSSTLSDGQKVSPAIQENQSQKP
jgi:RND family efflux transporter MFP subunit